MQDYGGIMQSWESSHILNNAVNVAVIILEYLSNYLSFNFFYRSCWVNFLPSLTIVCPLAFFSRMNFKILIFGHFFRFWSGRCHTPPKRRSRRIFTKKIPREKKSASGQTIVGKGEINPKNSVRFLIISNLQQI